jgi:hypothetical protein
LNDINLSKRCSPLLQFLRSTQAVPVVFVF